MKIITREQLTQLFKKTKRFKPPRPESGLENMDFESLKFLGWWDQTANAYYLVYKLERKAGGVSTGTLGGRTENEAEEKEAEKRKELVGLKFDVLRLSSRGVFARAFCELCHKHRKREDILLISTETKKKPKGVDYRTKGIYVCADPVQCNKDMKNTADLDRFITAILEG